MPEKDVLAASCPEAAPLDVHSSSIVAREPLTPVLDPLEPLWPWSDEMEARSTGYSTFEVTDEMRGGRRENVRGGFLALVVLAGLAACSGGHEDADTESTLFETTMILPNPAETTGGPEIVGDLALAPTSTEAGTTSGAAGEVDQPPKDACEPGDPALATRVHTQFGPMCAIQCVCGDMIGIDCGAAWDGIYYYVHASNFEVIATCGGACMLEPCVDCPPQGWTC